MWPWNVLKQYDQFVAFYFYCKIMLISISYNYIVASWPPINVLSKQNWLRNVERWMFIRITMLSLKSPQVTPTLWPLPTGSVHLAGCGVNLCSRDTASRDHAFPSGLLATPTTVSKTPHGRCVHIVKRPYCVYFQPLNGTWKHILTVFML